MRVAGVQVLVHSIDVGNLLEKLGLRVRVDLPEAGGRDLEMEMAYRAVFRPVGPREPVLALQEERRGLQCLERRRQGRQRFPRYSDVDVRTEVRHQVRTDLPVLAKR